MTRTFGLELELFLTDEQGRLVDRADALLESAARLPFYGTLVPEGGYDMVELNSGVASSLFKLERMLRGDLKQTMKATHRNDTQLFAASSATASWHTSREGKPRYLLNPMVFGNANQQTGKYLINEYRSCAGTHLHVSRERGRESEQFNLMTAMDPVFMLLSSSPFIHGQHRGSNARNALIRNKIFSQMPRVLGQLQPYITSSDDLRQRQEQAYQIIQGIVGNHPKFNAAYKPDTCCWGPLRMRDHTIESRSGDATLPTLILAQAALYKGVMRYAFDQGREVVVGNHRALVPKHDLVVLPHFKGLKAMEKEGLDRSLDSEYMRTHLTRLIEMAEESLPEEERSYLQPLAIMLSTQQSLANIIGSQFTFKQGSYISPQEAYAVQQQLATLFEEDLAIPGKTHDVLRHGREALPPLKVRQPVTYVPVPYQAPSPMPQSPPRAA